MEDRRQKRRHDEGDRHSTYFAYAATESRQMEPDMSDAFIQKVQELIPKYKKGTICKCICDCDR